MLQTAWVIVYQYRLGDDLLERSLAGKDVGSWWMTGRVDPNLSFDYSEYSRSVSEDTGKNKSLEEQKLRSCFFIMVEYF